MSRPRIDPTESLRNTRGSMGDGTLRGRVRIATPYDPRRLRRATSAISGGTPPVGEVLAVTGTVTVAGGGTDVLASMDMIQSQHGFGTVDAAGDVPDLPVTASYLAEVDVRWTDGHRDTSVPEVTLNGTAIDPVWPDDGGVWGRWVDQVGFFGTAGDTFDVKVTPSDGTQHDAVVTVRLMVVEPLRTVATAASATPTLETATADGWQDTNPRDVTTPADASAGDLLVMSVRVGNGRIDTPPTGWTEVVEHIQSGGSEFRAYLFTKTADGGAETATITGVKMADTFNYAVSVVVGAFSGVGALVSSGSANGGSWPSIAGAETGQLLIGMTSYHQTTGLYNAHPTSNFTPSGPSSVETSSAEPSSIDCSQVMGFLVLTADGATATYDNTDHGGTATLGICLAATFSPGSG